jgi:hypothetical protein
MPKLTKGLKDLKRSMAEPAVRREMWRNSKAPMPGMFSTLDELIRAAQARDKADKVASMRGKKSRKEALDLAVQQLQSARAREGK